MGHYWLTYTIYSIQGPSSKLKKCLRVTATGYGEYMVYILRYRLWLSQCFMFVPSKQENLTQCCFNVVPASQTLAQHWNNIEWMFYVFFQANKRRWLNAALFGGHRLHLNNYQVIFGMQSSYALRQPRFSCSLGKRTVCDPRRALNNTDSSRVLFMPLLHHHANANSSNCLLFK